MIPISTLPLSDESKKRISEEIQHLFKNSNIIIVIVSFSDNRLIIRAEQKILKETQQIDKKNLEKIVRDVFSDKVPSTWKVTISAVDFNRSDIDSIDASWVSSKLVELGLKPKHLSTYTGIDKTDLNNLLNGKVEFTEWQRVAFYYFFKYRYLSRFKN